MSIASQATITSETELPALAHTPVSGRRDDLRRGIALIMLSTMVFAAMNAGVKLLSGHIKPIEIGFFRQLFSLAPVTWMLMRQGGIARLRTRRPLGHLFRGLIGNFSMMVFFLSVAWLPLADATALSFSSPLFVTALSLPLLGEVVGIHRWSAVAVGFVGVIIMTHPSAAWFAPGAGAGAAVGLVAGFLSALMMITIRQLSRTEQPVTIVFYFATIGCLLFGGLLPFFWTRPSPLELGGLAIVGTLGGCSQLLMTQAYRHAPASVLAPFSYTSIVFSTVFGFLIWRDFPQPRVLTGAAIIIVSGLYIIYRETRRHAEPRSKPLAATH